MTYIVLFSLALSLLGVTVMQSGEAAVRSAIAHFAKGADLQDNDLLASVLHPEAQQFYAHQTGIVRLATAPYLDMIAQKKIGGVPREVQIEAVDINGDLAAAKAIFIGEKMRFDTYFSLMKTDGRWQIVSIVVRLGAR